MVSRWCEVRILNEVVMAETAVKIHVNSNAAVANEIVGGAPLKREMANVADRGRRQGTAVAARESHIARTPIALVPSPVDVEPLHGDAVAVLDVDRVPSRHLDIEVLRTGVSGPLERDCIDGVTREDVLVLKTDALGTRTGDLMTHGEPLQDNVPHEVDGFDRAPGRKFKSGRGCQCDPSVFNVRYRSKVLAQPGELCVPASRSELSKEVLVVLGPQPHEPVATPLVLVCYLFTSR